MQDSNIHSSQQELIKYFNSLITPNSIVVHMSSSMLVIICKHFNLSPESLYEFLKTYCRHNNIKLQEGLE